MDNAAPYILLLVIATVSISLILRGLFLLVKNAVKQALREYEQEKELRNGP